MNNPDELAALSASKTTGYGPCRVCGATGYSLSYGGAGICPACDAGIPPDVTRLRERAERAEAELAAIKETPTGTVLDWALRRAESAEAEVKDLRVTLQSSAEAEQAAWNRHAAVAAELAALKRRIAEATVVQWCGAFKGQFAYAETRELNPDRARYALLVLP